MSLLLGPSLGVRRSGWNDFALVHVSAMNSCLQDYTLAAGTMTDEVYLHAYGRSRRLPHRHREPRGWPGLMCINSSRNSIGACVGLGRALHPGDVAQNSEYPCVCLGHENPKAPVKQVWVGNSLFRHLYPLSDRDRWYS